LARGQSRHNTRLVYGAIYWCDTITKGKTKMETKKLLEQLDAIDKWEASKAQLDNLTRLVESIRKLEPAIKSASDNGDKRVNELLKELNSFLAVIEKFKQSPIDMSPVASAVSEIKKSLDKLKPVVNVPAPIVNVPDVNVDLSGVSRAIKSIKTEPPKAVSDEISAVYYNGKPYTPLYAPVDSMQSGFTEIVEGVKGKKIRTISLFVMAAGDTNIRLFSGAERPLSGLIRFIPSTGFVLNRNQDGWFETSEGDSLVLEQSGNINIGGLLTYIII